jgi:hypothetical protein
MDGAALICMVSQEMEIAATTVTVWVPAVAVVGYSRDVTVRVNVLVP